MLILGLESSCDETAAAVVHDGRAVLSNVIASQHDLHAAFGGVVPEIASRAHVERILPVVRTALNDAGVTLHDLDAIAVGNRPGLIGALVVSVSAAKALAWSLGKPLVGVDHVVAHLYAPHLMKGSVVGVQGSEISPTASLRQPEPQTPNPNPDSYPALGLVVSGGHTALYRCASPIEIERIGSTIDDAVGECYDKVATILGLAHPGGPKVDTLAQHGNERAHVFPLSRLSPTSLDFSYSGLKTAVLYEVRGVPTKPKAGNSTSNSRSQPEPRTPIPDSRLTDLCASFQRAAIGALMLKLERALDRWREEHWLGVEAPSAILVGGGVSANSRLRRDLAALQSKRNVRVLIPAMEYCLDNAAMIAGLAHHRLSMGSHDDLHLSASPSGAVR